jgi:hypothetical protein
MKRVHFAHVIVGARVLTRRPAAQPGAQGVQAKARTLSHRNLAAAPRSKAKGPSQSCCSLALAKTGEKPEQEGTLMFERFAFARPLAPATLSLALAAGTGASPAFADPAPRDVLKIYADIAQAAPRPFWDTAGIEIENRQMAKLRAEIEHEQATTKDNLVPGSRDDVPF